jgi:hypothetical protein
MGVEFVTWHERHNARDDDWEFILCRQHASEFDDWQDAQENA